MSRSLLTSVGSYAVTVFLLVSLNFFLPRALPGDPISVMMNLAASTDVQPEVREALASYYRLDRPIVVQYGYYLADLAHADLGASIRYGRPVSGLIAERLPWTVLLVVVALTLASIGGILAGVHSGWRRGQAADRGLLVSFLTLRSFPVFFLGSIALFVFAVRLGWFPLAGARTPFVTGRGPVGGLADIAHHLVLPSVTLAAQFAAGQFLLMRAGMVGELGADYLVLGRAKGLSERRLKYDYAARNALLPVVTMVALQLGFAVSSSVLVETVFSYPGLGRLLFDAVSFRDYPTLQGCFLVLGLVVISANLLADLLYRRLDPRTAQ